MAPKGQQQRFPRRRPRVRCGSARAIGPSRDERPRWAGLRPVRFRTMMVKIRHSPYGRNWPGLAVSSRSASRLANGIGSRSLRPGCPAAIDPSRSSQPNQAIPEADVQGDHVRVASRPRTSFRSIITAPESSHCQRIGKREPWINSVSKVRCPFTGGRQFYCCHKNASGSTRGRSRGCAQPSRCV